MSRPTTTKSNANRRDERARRDTPEVSASGQKAKRSEKKPWKIVATLRPDAPVDKQQFPRLYHKILTCGKFATRLSAEQSLAQQTGKTGWKFPDPTFYTFEIKAVS